MNRFLIVALLVLVGCSTANTTTFCTSKFCTEVREGSSKLKIKSLRSQDDFEFKIESMRELDAGGNEVGKNLPEGSKHSFETEVLNFTVSQMYKTTFEGAEADALNFTADIPGPKATLLVETFFIKKDITVKLCDSEYKVTNGSVKFNMEIKGWKFCGGGVVCKNDQNVTETGKFVEIEAKIEAKKSIKEDKEGKGGDKEKGKRLIIDDMVMKLPKAVVADGKCTQMVDDYPKPTQVGEKKQIAIFRFEKFDNKVFYDPIVEEYNAPPNTTKTPSTPPTTTEPPTTSSSTVSLSMQVACVAALVKLFA